MPRSVVTISKDFECAPYLQVSGAGWKLICRGRHGYGRGTFAYKLSRQELQSIRAAPDRVAALRAKHDEVVSTPLAKYSGNLENLRHQVKGQG